MHREEIQAGLQREEIQADRRREEAQVGQFQIAKRRLCLELPEIKVDQMIG